MTDSQTPPGVGSTTPKLDRWNASHGDQQWLSSLLTDPRMGRLLAVLQEQGIPGPVNLQTLPGDEGALNARMALMAASNMGYHIALRNLLTLTATARPIGQLAHDGWQGSELQNGSLPLDNTPA